MGATHPHGELGSIELHDARLSGFAVEAFSGKCVVSFAHLVGSHERETEGLSEVWSYRAEVVLEGLRSLTLSGGPLEPEGYVNSGRIVIAGGEVDPLRLLAAQEELQIELQFFTGGELRVSAIAGQLFLLEAVKLLQERRWST